jgi:hypothetical protein
MASISVRALRQPHFRAKSCCLLIVSAIAAMDYSQTVEPRSVGQ